MSNICDNFIIHLLTSLPSESFFSPSVDLITSIVFIWSIYSYNKDVSDCGSVYSKHIKASGDSKILQFKILIFWLQFNASPLTSDCEFMCIFMLCDLWLNAFLDFTVFCIG